MDTDAQTVVADAPETHNDKPWQFCKANASAMAHRANEVLRAKRDARQTAIVSNALPPVLPVDRTESGLARAKRMDAHILRIEEQLADATEAKDVQSLMAALEKAYNVWALLTGHPRPGIARVPRQSGTKRDIEPV